MNSDLSPQPSMRQTEFVASESPPSNDVVELTAVTAVIQSAILPFAESQKVVAQEATKQTQIIAVERTKMFWGVCVLALVVLLLCAFAIYLGKDQIAEKVLIAVVGFLGGLGFAKQIGGKGV